ncbi:MAG: hypothetical protein WCL02_07070 [bacterium]
MNTSEAVLIVEPHTNDQQIIAGLFKRSLPHLRGSSLTITYAASLSEAKDHLSKKQFSVVTLNGEFPSFIDPLFGHMLIPFIKEKQTNSKIIMISEKTFIKEGLKRGADLGFHKEYIRNNVKLNENFELILID